jgi:hypothetical protein
VANSEKIRALTVYTQIDERFKKGGSAAVEQYVSKLDYPINMSFTGTTALSADADVAPVITKYDMQSMLYDFGGGRVSQGMRSLTLLSKLCKGVPSSDLFLFNNVMYTSNPYEIKNASDDTLTAIVIGNLGMTVVVANMGSYGASDLAKFNELCLSMGKDVRCGSFDRNKYEGRVMLLTKRLVLLASKNLGGI